MNNTYPTPPLPTKKKGKKVMIIIGVIFGMFVLLVVLGGISASKQTEEQTIAFNANREKILADFEKALSSEDLSTCESIADQYNFVDNYELKALISKFESLKDTKKEAEKESKRQAKETAKFVNLNDPITGDTLQVIVKKAEVKTHVGGAILGESSVSGVVYLCFQFSYKNISKSPTHEQPSLQVVSPDGSVYTSDISATALYTSEMKDFDIEVFSQLNPQVHSNDVEVFKLPSSMQNQTGWRLEVTLDSGAFSSGTTKYLKLN